MDINLKIVAPAARKNWSMNLEKVQSSDHTHVKLIVNILQTHRKLINLFP